MKIEVDPLLITLLMKGEAEVSEELNDIVAGELSFLEHKRICELLMKLLVSWESNCLLMIYYYYHPKFHHPKFSHFVGQLLIGDIMEFQEQIMEIFSEQNSVVFFDLVNGGYGNFSIDLEENQNDRYHFDVAGFYLHGDLANMLQNLDPNTSIYKSKRFSFDYYEKSLEWLIKQSRKIT